jgi:hypothetical protein
VGSQGWQAEASESKYRLEFRHWQVEAVGLNTKPWRQDLHWLSRLPEQAKHLLLQFTQLLAVVLQACDEVQVTHVLLFKLLDPGHEVHWLEAGPEQP